MSLFFRPSLLLSVLVVGFVLSGGIWGSEGEVRG